ncbi:MAG TPA: ROK family protein [Prolixibacteraceae bacterium]|nr:ROK family protein [Prolixibacteraceae bacterium]
MDKNSQEYFIGLDIGGTKCAVVVGDKSFQIHKKIKFDTRVERGYNAILDEFQQHIYSMFHEFPKENLKGIGISCGGPLDSKKGVIYSPPNLTGWDNVPIVEIFRNKYGVPVSIQNDANACALAEWLMGAGKGTQNMIFLTFGTGMGSGLILNGQLYAGTNDLGGEVGHIRMAETGAVGFGKPGSFEGFCCGGGIAQLAKSMLSEYRKKGRGLGELETLDIEAIDAKIVAGAANRGDEVANEIIRVSAEYLGKALAILIDILNPQCIVIGSIYTRNVELFKPHIDKMLRKEAIPSALEVCEIRPAELGESIGDFAALCVAVYQSKF